VIAKKVVFLVPFTLIFFCKSAEKIPFVYNDAYNIRFFGLEKLHPFDTHKYSKIVERLKERFKWNNQQFHKAGQATDQQLKLFHDQKYIDALNQSWKEFFMRSTIYGFFLLILSQYISLKKHPIILFILGIYGISGLLPFQAKQYSKGLRDSSTYYPIFMFLPGFLLRYCFLRPMKYAVNGTEKALQEALKKDGPGWCVNLSGGYHHARQAGGFCFFNDVAIALKKQILKNSNFKALIIDLDFHCGDGNADFQSQYPVNITICDIYCGNNYPFGLEGSYQLEKNISKPNPIVSEEEYNDWIPKRPNPIIKGKNGSSWYCDLLKKNLAEIKTRSLKNPDWFDCIIYNAGTDVYEKDALGNFMGLSKKQIIERDEIVFRFAKKNNIPIVQVLSGGYDKKMGAEIVADSLINIYTIM